MLRGRVSQVCKSCSTRAPKHSTQCGTFHSPKHYYCDSSPDIDLQLQCLLPILTTDGCSNVLDFNCHCTKDIQAAAACISKISCVDQLREWPFQHAQPLSVLTILADRVSGSYQLHMLRRPKCISYTTASNLC